MINENKIQTRPDWDEDFLDIAKSVGRRATCLRRRYGAIIVKDKIIISTGYNGSPRGEANCIDTGICERERLKVPKGERYELCVAVHAEQNAIINADPVKMEGSTIYIAGFNVADNSIASGEPCKLCRRMIKNARISKVVYQNADGKLIKADSSSLT
ncbi:MAG: dCMP deaminase family protein [Selenomonadaceae bacterium]|nr:dCMP deaminase family protein [Selenomonadaceae bacterium]